MRFPRSCGTLLHPTSFPSLYGMGDLGPAALEFLDFLQETGQTIWQVLPLGPTGAGNSPYHSWSAFAGNPWLISPDRLAERGLLERHELEAAAAEAEAGRKAAADAAAAGRDRVDPGSPGEGAEASGKESPGGRGGAIAEEWVRGSKRYGLLPPGDSCRIDYALAFRVKEPLFRLAYDRFLHRNDDRDREKLERFRMENHYWLSDYTAYMVLRELHRGESWERWEEGASERDPETIAALRASHAREIGWQEWLQYEFFNQWASIREEARHRGVRIIGDLPIYVSHDSADVWAHRHCFSLDPEGNPEFVAGVPPDYFSTTGQLWGNPVYRWDVLARDGYRWWMERFRQAMRMADAVRVDHFRGFEAGWQVPSGAPDAVDGVWVKGPGHKFFDTVQKVLGPLPVIAENLGVITEEVEALRRQFGFPGMNVLQFAFDDDPKNGFLPHNHEPNNVVYSGTHDNDTTRGWYEDAPELHRHCMRVYTRSDGSDPARELIRLGMLSVCDQAIFPLQDFMDLGPGHRMNLPGTEEHNWEWRYTREMLERVDREWIRDLIRLSNRPG